MTETTARDAAFDAVRSGDPAALERVLTDDPSAAAARDGNGVSLLMLALYHRHQEMAVRIVAAGAEPDLFEAAALGDTARVSALLDGGAGVGDRSADGFTALHLAAFFGRAGAAEALLSRGADVEAVAANPSKVRPLHSAVAGRSAEVVRVLLAAEPDLEAPQEGGFTALMGAAANGLTELVDLLLAAGADPGTTADDGKTAADFARAKGHDGLAARLAAG